MHLTLPSTAAILIALSPFFTAVFARLAGEHSTLPTSRAITAGTVAFTGVTLVVLGTPTTNTQGQSTWYGPAFALLAAALWGWYPVITRPLLTHHSALRITAWTSTTGAAALLPLATATGFTQHATITPRSWFALAYSVLLVTVAGLVLWYRAVARAGSAPVMLWMFAVPVTAALFATLTGEQPLTRASGHAPSASPAAPDRARPEHTPQRRRTRALPVLGLFPLPRTKVTSDGHPCSAEADPLRRRTALLATAALAAPAQLLAAVGTALAVTPDPTGSPGSLDGRLAKARAGFDAGFDAGKHPTLLQDVPALLGDLHADVHTAGTDLSYARLFSCYSLTAEALIKLGCYDQARITSDRATTYAELSGSPLVAAAAARQLSIVLRHQNQSATAQRLVNRALAQVEATGLKTAAQSSTWARMLCTTAYTAARAGDRDLARTLIEEAARAARDLPGQPPEGRLFPLTPAAVTLYSVGVHWALGDAGAALAAGRTLRPGQFRTAERRARMHTDLGRAWWQWGKAEQTASSLLAAARVSLSGVRDRPAIREIVTELAQRHPQVTGVRDLVLATKAQT